MTIKLKKTVARCLAGLILTTSFYGVITNNDVVYAAETSKLVWNTMEVTEKNYSNPNIQQPVTSSSPIIQTPQTQDHLLNFISNMQQQQSQLMTAILSVTSAPKSTDNQNFVTNIQQQLQQLMNMVVQMQQQNMMIVQMALQTPKSEPIKSLDNALPSKQQVPIDPIIVSALVNEPKHYGNEVINKKIDIVPFPEIEQTSNIAIVERKRIAPQDEAVNAKTPNEFIAEAVQDAAYEGYYQNSMAVFDYNNTSLYKIYCKEGYLTVIRLQVGENVVSINGGDTTRWIVDHTNSGSQAQVLLKPVRGGLDTNFVIITDKHTYQIQAKATSWYNPIVSWNYPQEVKAKLQATEKKLIKEEKETITLSAQNPEQLNFNYKVSGRGDVDEWKPKTVFDDGKKVYIKITAVMKKGEAPVLVLRDEKGKIAIVNYRMKNEYYIVDRLFKQAELRLGTNDFVRIERKNALITEE